MSRQSHPSVSVPSWDVKSLADDSKASTLDETRPGGSVHEEASMVTAATAATASSAIDDLCPVVITPEEIETRKAFEVRLCVHRWAACLYFAVP
jgi:hypothetical protein